MIKSLALANFKSVGKTLINNDGQIEEGKLNFAPLTIFCGKNSSGKSTVLQSILLLAQTIQNNITSHTLVLNGPMVNLGRFNDIKSKFNDSNEIVIDIEIFIPKPVKETAIRLISDEQYIVREIFDKKKSRNLFYILSKSFNGVKNAVIKDNIINTYLNCFVDEEKWAENNSLSTDIKDLMVKYNANYSLWHDYDYETGYINLEINTIIIHGSVCFIK